MRSSVAILALLYLLALLGPAGGASAGVLETVKARGHLLCGVSDGQVGFSTMEPDGTWRGLDVDFCQALAAAVLGSKKDVRFVSVPAAERFAALKRGDIDVLDRAATWTLKREAELGVRFTAVLFHDGQGFLVRRAEAITSAFELSGASVCVEAGSQAEKAMGEFFGARRMRTETVSSVRWDDLVKSYQGRNCSVLSADVSALAVARSRMSQPASHSILPELISKEPSGPYVRQGDEAWFSIVRWTVMALIEAEELGITSANALRMHAAGSSPARRLLGAEGGLGTALGLDDGWAMRAIQQVGSYGEMFERNLGAGSRLRLQRGLNALWTKGGLMYAAPFR